MPLIYESPDHGKTVYAREFGQPDRQLISGIPDNSYDRIYIWHDIMAASDNNPALRELLDQAIVLYNLSKDD